MEQQHWIFHSSPILRQALKLMEKWRCEIGNHGRWLVNWFIILSLHIYEKLHKIFPIPKYIFTVKYSNGLVTNRDGRGIFFVQVCKVAVAKRTFAMEWYRAKLTFKNKKNN